MASTALPRQESMPGCVWLLTSCDSRRERRSTSAEVAAAATCVLTLSANALPDVAIAVATGGVPAPIVTAG